MASKYQLISEIYNETTKAISSRPSKWMEFLQSACRNYKCRFDEQVLIYEQRADATAVLEIDRWNRNFGRWVNRGARGIAVFDNTNKSRQRLKYYFDISDTHGAETSRAVPIWSMKPEYETAVIETLENIFGELAEKEDLPSAIISAAQNAVEDNFTDYMDDLLSYTENSFLEELDKENISVMLRNLLQDSIAYMMMVRCDIDPTNHFETDYFAAIVNFNTPKTISALGIATSDIAEMRLKEIAATIRYFEKNSIRTFAEAPTMEYDKDNKANERSMEHGNDIQHARGLQPARPDTTAGGHSPWEIRPAAPQLSGESQTGNIHQSPDQRNDEPAFEGNRGHSQSAARADGKGDGTGGERNREPESVRPDEMDGTDEQHSPESGGSHTQGTNLQLEAEAQAKEIVKGGGADALPPFLDESLINAILLNVDDDLKVKKSEIDAFFAANSDLEKRKDFLKQAHHQGRYTEILVNDIRVGYKPEENQFIMWKGGYLSREAESTFSWGVITELTGALIDKKEYYIQPIEKKLPSVQSQQIGLAGFGLPEQNTMPLFEGEQSSLFKRFEISQQIIDEALSLGGNRRDSLLRIVAYFKKDFPTEQNAAFLQQEYSVGGRGFVSQGHSISIWFDEHGFHIADGKSARRSHATVLSWQDAAKRIRALLDYGRYAPAEVLEQEEAYDRKKLAQSLWFIVQDFSDDARNTDLMPTTQGIYGSNKGAPDEMAALAELLQDKQQLETIIEEVKQFRIAYAENPKLLRFHFHRADDLLHGLESLQRESLSFPIQPDFSFEPSQFITEDEIEDLFLSENNTYDGKFDTCTYFLLQLNKSERIKYLKDKHGYSGHYNDGTNLQHESSGITYSRGDLMQPHASIKLKWAEAEKCISRLISQKRYLTANEIKDIPNYERRRLARAVFSFYHNVPEETPRPFPVESDYDTGVKLIAQQLESSERVDEIYEMMAPIWNTTKEDDRYYTVRKMAMEDISAYRDGSFFRMEKHFRGMEKSVPAEDKTDILEFSIDSSEHPAFYVREAGKDVEPQYTNISFALGNRLLGLLDEKQHRERESNERMGWYHKTNFKIHAIVQGEKFDYEGRFDIGDGEGDLIADIKNFYNYALSPTGESLYAEDKNELQQGKNKLLPFLEQHTELTDQDNKLLTEIMSHENEWFPMDIDALREVEIIGRYAMEREQIAIARYSNGKFYNRYGYDEENDRFDSVAGGFPTFEAAEKALYSHRPKAEKQRAQDRQLPTEKEQEVVAPVSAEQEDTQALAAQVDEFFYRFDQNEYNEYFPSREEGLDYYKWYFVNRNTMELVEEIETAVNTLLDNKHDDELRLMAETVTEQIYAEIKTKLLGQELYVDDRTFVVDSINTLFGTVSLKDMTFAQSTGFPIFRSEPLMLVLTWYLEQQAVREAQAAIEAVGKENPPDREKDDTPDLEKEKPLPPPKQKREQVRFSVLHPEIPKDERIDYRITDPHLGDGTASERYSANIAAIRALKHIESENRLATEQEQEVLAQYVGWGGLANCFEETHMRYGELRNILDEDEFTAARASTLTAFYTSPTIIEAMYQALEQMGFRTGNIIEPACGTGNFIGMLPESMAESKVYGVELDSISGRIARQLYQNSSIAIDGFERVEIPDSFADVSIGNVPFGDFKVLDHRYNKHNWLIHDYFFGKTLDKVRPDGIVAFITSKGTLDKAHSKVRKYLAQHADLIGAIRLPNTAFKRNAGTEVTSDIIFLQKREQVIDIEPDWVHLARDANGIEMNSYFVQHPDMILGEMEMVSGQFGMESTCKPYEDSDLSDLLSNAIGNLHAEIPSYELDEQEVDDETIPADPNVRNFSYTIVDGALYFRTNSIMQPVRASATAENRIRGMIALRDCTRTLIEYQTENYPEDFIQREQTILNQLYDDYVKKYGRINDRGNSLAFRDDSAYYLLCSLEVMDDEGNFVRKADMFTKRTIRPHTPVTHVDTASEALAVSMSEKAKVDIAYMSELCGKTEDELEQELAGVIYRNIKCATIPEHIPKAFMDLKKFEFVTADEYLSGNVREKLKMLQALESVLPSEKKALQGYIKAMEAVQPAALSAAEIGVRIGATWIPPKIYQQFMFELFRSDAYARSNMNVLYSKYTGEWNISNKSMDNGNRMVTATYGTKRINAYHIMEQTLNLKDVRVYDTVFEDGNEKRVLNKKETAIAQDRQELIKSKFTEWIWKDIDRRELLCGIYNEKFNSIRPREYDGSHLTFPGMNPEIALREHQVNAIAHVLYGGNTLLAHQVGAGKTFEMVAAAMESKRLGLCTKSLIVVPDHIIGQFAAEWLQLYPSANLLVSTKKDFETKNRKKFCARIATGDYDAIIIGHSQFEKIPVSAERQEAILRQQINEMLFAIREARDSRAENYTVKQMERTKKSLENKLKKLNDQSRKDDIVTFEQLGCDRLFVDESHYFKNLFLMTKMRNVGGIAQTESQKSSDLFMKCRYLDELTGNKGIVFATGTPISNSMVELYTIQRYLQFETLQRMGLQHFDEWASCFGETVTAIELSPEGTGYRAKTRFAKFYNLPELMAMFKEVADIQTADMLNLPVPKANFHTIVLEPSLEQKELVASLAQRAEDVRNQEVDPSVDNMLRITNDGRKLALDVRLIDPTVTEDESSKVEHCSKNIYNIWQQTAEQKSTQLAFCDLSTPKSDGSFSVYVELKKKLIEKGIPEEEIAFIHDGATRSCI